MFCLKLSQNEFEHITWFVCIETFRLVCLRLVHTVTATTFIFSGIVTIRHGTHLMMTSLRLPLPCRHLHWDQTYPFLKEKIKDFPLSQCEGTFKVVSKWVWTHCLRFCKRRNFPTEPDLWHPTRTMINNQMNFTRFVLMFNQLILLLILHPVLAV